MEKKYNERLTFDVANNRFIEQGRDDIRLCEDGYEGWKKKSKFYDLIENDYFWAIPKNVFQQKSCHPKRATKNRKQTNIEKYGSPCSLHGQEIKDKVKKTNIERYGVENVFQSETIKEKIKNTIVTRYGVENVSKNEDVKNKKTKSSIEHFNVKHPMHAAVVKEKLKNTSYAKYNKPHFKTSYIIEETKENFNSWYNNLLEPKPSYTFFVKNLNSPSISLKILENLINNWEENKTSLEVLAEQLFYSKHYNLKPIQIQKNYKPDFKLSDTVYVNVDGLYWHSEANKNQNYHFSMREHFEQNNLRLFQFYENEIKNKSNIVKSIVDNSFGNTAHKIFARKCTIKIIDQKTADEFLTNNHLMGTKKAKHVGLFNNNDLVCLLSYKEFGNICKIERFCTILNTNVVGGFSKLLKYLECNLLKPSTTEIHNWIDLRYGTGKHLLSKDFKLIKETLGWKWTDYNETFNRLHCRANMDDRKLSEKKHAEELGLTKIYDAGQRLYVKKL